MNSVIGGLLTSGRSTVRSMAMPSSAMTASVMAKATRERDAASRAG